MGHCMTNGTVWHQHDNRSSLFKQHKGKLQEGIGTLIKMSSQSGYLVEQSELLFHFSEFRKLWLGLFWLPTSPGLTCSKTQQAHYSLDKQVWTYWTQTHNNPVLPRHSPLSQLYLWLGSVSLSHTLLLGVCLPDTCLAWPSFSLISSVNVRTCEGHLPILLCESPPALCLCQQLGTDSHPRRLQSSLGGPMGKGSTSPQTDSLICMPINHSQNWHPATQQGMTWCRETQCAKLQRYVILDFKAIHITSWLMIEPIKLE